MRDSACGSYDAMGLFEMTNVKKMRAGGVVSQVRRPGRPARDDKSAANIRKAMLESALTLFAERGFDGASMRDIAARAGVDHSLLRYHFQDKANLWRYTVEQMIDRLSADMATAWQETEGKPLVERFKGYLRAYVRYCAAYPEHARIMVQESLKPSDRVDWIVEKGIRRQHGTVIPVLEELIAEGHLPDVAITSLIYALTASAQTIFMLAVEVKAAHGVDYRLDAEVERHADALIAIFVK